MKVYQSFEWSLFYVLECKSVQIHGFAEFFLQIVGYRTGSIYRYMRRVLAQITGDETFETVHYQFVYGRFLAELYDKGNHSCQETVGHRLTVNALYNLFLRKLIFVIECKTDVFRKLFFQAVGYQAFSHIGTAAFVADDISQGRNIVHNLFSIVVA